MLNSGSPDGSKQVPFVLSGSMTVMAAEGSLRPVKPPTFMTYAPRMGARSTFERNCHRFFEASGTLENCLYIDLVDS